MQANDPVRVKSFPDRASAAAWLLVVGNYAQPAQRMHDRGGGMSPLAQSLNVAMALMPLAPLIPGRRRP
jgi:hypothetical protein